MNDRIAKVLAVCTLGLVVNPAAAIQFNSLTSPGTIAPPPLTASASVRPTINVSSKGVISVSLLSTGAFNAQDVKVDSVRFGPAGASAFGKAQLADLNNDGTMDLLLHFKTQDTGITCGATQVTVTGLMQDGQPFTASDQIDTKGC